MNVTELKIYILIAVSSYIFIKRKDFLVKSLSLFIILFLVFVGLSTKLFGKDFSARPIINHVELSIIVDALLIFYFGFTLSTRKLPEVDTSLTNRKRVSMTHHFLVLLCALPVFIFGMSYFIDMGYRLDGSFLENKHQRSTVDYYIYVYAVALLAASRNSYLVIFLFGILSFVYILAAERMKAYLYVISLLILVGNIGAKNKTSIAILLFGFGFAEFISSLRSNLFLTEGESALNVTHFGEVSVSSLYLLSESTFFSFSEKFSYFSGILLGNFIPASLIPAHMDLRYFVSSLFDIPGGGWLPVFIFSVSNFLGVFIAGYGCGYFYDRIIRASNRARADSEIKVFYLTLLTIFIATSPNWFMYTPYQVLKMPAYGFVVSFILVRILRLSPKKRELEKRYIGRSADVGMLNDA